MAETLSVTAAYASVVEDDEDGLLFIGFAEGEEEDEPYVLFRQSLDGGPIWFEVNDESFGAENAVQSVAVTANGLTITIAPEFAAQFGFATLVEIVIGPDCEDAILGVTALRDMLGARMIG